MYPTLSDILKDLFGINVLLPIQTFGLLLGISFGFAAYILFLELKRKEENGLLSEIHTKETIGLPATSGELLIAGIFGFITGFKLLYIITEYSDFVNDTQGILLSGTGSLPGGIAGAVLFIWIKYREKNKNKLDEPVEQQVILKPHQLVGNITMIAAVSGLIGAKIFHNLENLDEFEKDPLHALVSFSGLTMYGGLICGTIAVTWYGKKFNIKPLILSDAAAPALMLAYGTGRLGCQLAGDGDWGIVNLNPKPGFLSWLPDWAWAYNYPRNVVGEGIPIPGCEGRHCMMLPDAVYPTPFYEAIACILLFFVLWSYRKKITTPGMMFSIYLLLNGIERFFIEKIRVNTKYHIAGHEITQAQIISTLLIIVGITGIIYLRKTKQNQTVT
ncbi:MAG: prolipoprotein diacylglyceryl transferase family protein [Bacteroidota bacterium]